MIEKNSDIKLDETCGKLYEHFEFVDTETETVKGSGVQIVSDTMLLRLYEENPELASKDVRLAMLLNPDIEEVSEPSQLDRIESVLNELTSGSVSTSAVDEAILEGVNEV